MRAIKQLLLLNIFQKVCMGIVLHKETPLGRNSELLVFLCAALAMLENKTKTPLRAFQVWPENGLLKMSISVPPPLTVN